MYKYIWTAIVSYTDQWFTGQNGLRGVVTVTKLVVKNLGGELGAHNESKWSQCYVHYSSEKLYSVFHLYSLYKDLLGTIRAGSAFEEVLF